MAITAFLCRSPGLLNRGPGGPASLGAGFLYRILSPTRLIPNWSDLRLINRPEGFLYCTFAPTDWISCALSYIIVQRPPSSCGRHKLHSFNPSTVKVILCYSSTCYLHLLFTQVYFLFWQPGRVVGQYTFTLDPYLLMLSVKQGGIKYHFWVFGMTRPGIEPRSPGPLSNTLTSVLISNECFWVFVWRQGLLMWFFMWRLSKSLHVTRIMWDRHWRSLDENILDINIIWYENFLLSFYIDQIIYCNKN